MDDYWPFYLRECRSPIITVLSNPDGRTDQELWNLVGLQQESVILVTAYYQYTDWIRTRDEDAFRKILASVVEVYETHTYDRFAKALVRPSKELSLTPSFSQGEDSSLIDCGARWVPGQEFLS